MKWNRTVAGWLLVGVLALLPVAALAGPQEAKKFEGKVGGKDVSISYLLALPADYESQPDRKWPVVYFLHGAGERGDDLNLVKRHGPPRMIEKGHRFDAIVVSPQCPKDQWWDIATLKALADDIDANYRVDLSRVYLTGLSMGGFGSFAWAGDQPWRFAAVAPICGGADEKAMQAMAKRQMPLWIFHGDADQRVSPDKSKQAYAWYVDAGGKNGKLTLYPGVGHDSWTKTYADPQLWVWMFQQQRPKNVRPPKKK